MTASQTILKQTGLHIGGRFVSVLLGVAVLATTTRLLGPALFGVYGTALAYLQLFGILMDFGLTVTTLDALGKSTVIEQKNIIGSLVVLRSLLSTITTAIAFIILQWFPYAPSIKHAIYLASLLFIFYSFQQLFTSVFQFKQSTMPIVVAEFFGRSATLLGLWVAAFFSGGVMSVILAGVIGNLVVILLLWRSAYQVLPWSLSLNTSLWKDILVRSWPIGISIAFNLVYFKADTIILSLLRSSETVGLYSAPYKILEVLIAFPPLFLGMVLPRWSAAVAQKNWKEFQHWLEWTLSLTAMIALPLVAGTLVTAHELMGFVAGSAYLESGAVLQVLIIATGSIFFANVFGYAIVALGLQKKMIPFYSSAAVSSLLLYYWAILRFGVLGAAWTTVLIEIFILFAGFFIVFASIKKKIMVPYLTKYVISSIIMYFFLFFTHNVIHILFSVATGSFVYFFALYSIGGLNILKTREITVLKGV